MAKRFLDTLDDSFDEGSLADLIPGSRKAPTRRSSPARSGRSKSEGRKKSFLTALEDVKPSPKNASTSKKKSFLGALEEVFDGMNEAELDTLFPTSREEVKKPIQKQEARITTSIDSQLLSNIRKISREHKVPIKEVIQEALKLWLSRKK